MIIGQCQKKKEEVIRMKAFVYDKKTSKTIVMLCDVICVQEFADCIEITTPDNKHRFDVKQVKTRIYQN